MINKVSKEKQEALSSPTGVAFVTVDTVDNANRIKYDHNLRLCFKPSFSNESSVEPVLRTRYWHIRKAPVPDDIYWYGLFF